MSDPIRDLKLELLAAAERQQRSAPIVLGLGGRLRPRRVMLIMALLSVAAVLALVVSAPWRHSPGFLEEAQAALTPPPDTVEYAKWEVTYTYTKPACTVTRGPTELWVDTVPPYRWRALLRDVVPFDAPTVSEPACWKGVTSELGGTVQPVCTAASCEPTLRFVAPNTLHVSQASFPVFPDPAHTFQDAIRNGLAHDEGTTKLGGRTVERIRIDPPSLFCHANHGRCPPPTYVYVDPQTFHPIEIHQPIFGVRSVMRFLTFEYLPRTPENLKLTNIRAQHPHAVETKSQFP
jgi:hypothetical protein